MGWTAEPRNEVEVIQPIAGAGQSTWLQFEAEPTRGGLRVNPVNPCLSDDFVEIGEQ